MIRHILHAWQDKDYYRSPGMYILMHKLPLMKYVFPFPDQTNAASSLPSLGRSGKYSDINPHPRNSWLKYRSTT